MCTICIPATHRGQKKASESLKLEIHIKPSYECWESNPGPVSTTAKTSL